ncbi:4-(cytidine 5'-diphospho)-2-C-methyl-D-erythritol kinase [Candidatus Margulisiibacteriota bacterium]
MIPIKITKQTTNTIYLKTPAKINLILKVGNNRPDGYHNIWSLVQCINFFDKIKITKTKSGCIIKTKNKQLPTDKSNLMYKAFDLLKKKYKFEGGIYIHINKYIPIGAGLGGGSSNAAGILFALNKLYNLKIPLPTLQKLGSQIGSDVPLFLSKSTTNIIEGRGEKVTPLKNSSKLNLLLITFPFHISTKEAYQLLDKFRTSVRAYERTGFPNDFEQLLFGSSRSPITSRSSSSTEHSEVRTERQREVYRDAGQAVTYCINFLKSENFPSAHLTGSGPTLYTIVDKKPTCVQFIKLKKTINRLYKGKIIKTQTN